MSDQHSDHTGKYIKYILIALAIVLAALFAFLAVQYRTLRREHFHALRGTLNASQVTSVRPWMTFDYISVLFAVPRQYMKEQLNITDPHYPLISIGTYAKDEHIDVASAENQIENVLKSYLAPQNSSST